MECRYGVSKTPPRSPGSWARVRITRAEDGRGSWRMSDRASVTSGLVYKRSDLSADVRHACCAAQMFLSNGEGVVFRGAPGSWFNPETKQFHLDEAAAKVLIELVIAEYRLQHDSPPKELFIHASSNFGDEEWAGFEKGAGTETKVLGIQISDAYEDLKLYRMGKYPTIRGTALPLGDRNAYLWTSGFVPRLRHLHGAGDTQPHHGPGPARRM